jgi:tetratricopeptide (TPR) repeat protein
MHAWFPARSGKEHVSVTFRVHKNGSVSWLELTDSCRLDSVNQSAQDAVFYASPFSPLPPQLSDSLDICASFDSEYHPAAQAGYARPLDSNITNSGRLLASATAARKEGKVDKAVDDLTKALQMTPYDARVRDLLVQSYIEQAKTATGEEAIARLHQALLIDPESSQARALLNRLIESSGKSPVKVEDRVTLARSYEKTSHYDDALCEYGEAWLLSKDKNLVPAINAVCVHRRKYADVQKWLTVCNRYDNIDCRLALARAYEACGETDNAKSEYQKILARDPANQAVTKLLNNLNPEIEKSQANDQPADTNSELSDDFPYGPRGTRSLSVRQVLNRKVSVDYLSSACPKQITRWAVNRIPLRVYVEPGYGVPGWKPQFNKYIIDAFAAWVTASEGRLTYQVVNYPKDANIVCHFIADPAK